MALQVKLGEHTYELSKRLRVAYKIQGAHAHKSYQQVFEGIGDMGLEKQIEIIFYSFQDANPTSDINKQQFTELFLDNYGLAQLMTLLGEIVEGITYNGMSEDEVEELKKKQAQLQERMTERDI